MARIFDEKMRRLERKKKTMSPQMRALSEAEVKRTISPILNDRFGTFGLDDVAVSEEEDFDGELILRAVARVQNQVPTRRLIDTLDAISLELLDKGDRRFVFLSTRTTDDEIGEGEESQ